MGEQAGLDPWHFTPDPWDIDLAAALLAGEDPFSPLEEWQRPRFRRFKVLIGLAIDRGELPCHKGADGKPWIWGKELAQWVALRVPQDELPPRLARHLGGWNEKPVAVELPLVTKRLPPAPEGPQLPPLCQLGRKPPYTTPLMEIQAALIEEFYADWEPGMPAPTNETLETWLKQQRIGTSRLSGAEKRALILLTKPPEKKSGGRPRTKVKSPEKVPQDNAEGVAKHHQSA